MSVELLESIYKSIGPAGVILALLGLFGLYLALKNLIFLNLVHKEFTAHFERAARPKNRAFERAYRGDNPLLSIVWDIVHTHAEHSKDIRAEVAYLFHRNFESVSKGLYWIRLISVISPLLGLLGTVFGMVKVFQTIASNANPDATILAAGIWEALITTAMGLSIAIPILMLYYLLLLRFKGFHIEAIEYSYRALDIRNKYTATTNKV
ncbi:MAG: MotA/TolQ/ExbB proton channel family protein [Pseudomonadota bacterium]